MPALSRSDKIRMWAGMGFLAVLFGTLGVMRLLEPGPGDACRDHVDCRPAGQCLRISSYRATPDPEGADELTRRTNEMARDIVDPLSPHKDYAREAPTIAGYCTVPCTTDDDCPTRMRCGEAMAFDDVGPGPDWIAGQGKPISLCVRR